MPAPTIMINYAHIARLIDHIQQQQTKVTAMQRRLQSQLDILNRGAWQSDAATRFYADYIPVLEGVGRLSNALGSTGQTLERIARLFKEAEQAGGDAIPMPEGGLYSGKVGATSIDHYEAPANGVPFVKGAGDGDSVHPSDVAQQSIGDCYLIASLASLAQQDPQHIRDMIRDNGNGTYTITFYEEYRFLFIGTGTYHPVEITVTPNFPVGPKGEKLHAAYGDIDGTKTEIWTALIEQGYAQWKGGYGTIVGGWPSDAWTDLTGVPSSTHSVQAFSIEQLAQMHGDGQLMSFATRQNGSSGWGSDGPSAFYTDHHFADRHAYFVSGVNLEAGTVQLSNPWNVTSHPPVNVPFDELNNFDNLFVNANGN